MVTGSDRNEQPDHQISRSPSYRLVNAALPVGQGCTVSYNSFPSVTGLTHDIKYDSNVYLRARGSVLPLTKQTRTGSRSKHERIKDDGRPAGRMSGGISTMGGSSLLSRPSSITSSTFASNTIERYVESTVVLSIGGLFGCLGLHLLLGIVFLLQSCFERGRRLCGK
jgi:hypothetical protein